MGEALGLPCRFAWGDWPQDGWMSGGAVCSRWPIATRGRRPLPGQASAAGAAVHAGSDGPRGIFQVFVVMLGYRLHASIRQNQVRELFTFVSEAASLPAWRRWQRGRR